MKKLELDLFRPYETKITKIVGGQATILDGQYSDSIDGDTFRWTDGGITYVSERCRATAFGDCGEY